jgi:hypothetical protein
MEETMSVKMRNLILAIMAILLFCSFAQAGVIVFSNFGINYSYSGAGDYTNYGSIMGDLFSLDLAGRFVMGPTSYRLESMRLALSGSAPDYGDDFELWLMADAGVVPGTILESINYTDPVPWWSNGSTVLVSSTAHTLLAANTAYWIGISSSGMNTVDWWRTINNTSGNLAVLRSNETSWYVEGNNNYAFEVTGTPVPEPSEFLLLFISLGAVGLLAWCKKK